MTTMTDKLIAKALEYEQKAAHLRFAAAEMNGDAVNGKQQTAGLTLDAAIALRKAQRGRQNGQQGHQGVPQTRATMPEREATVRAFLQAADGPQTTRAIQDKLEAAGQGCSSSWALRVLGGMKDVRKEGLGARTAWALGKAARKKPRVSTREVERTKRQRIAEVLNAYDRETPKAPGEVAKSFGLTVAQSGLAPLAHQGYLKKKRGGYVRTTKAYVIEKPAATHA